MNRLTAKRLLYITKRSCPCKFGKLFVDTQPREVVSQLHKLKMPMPVLLVLHLKMLVTGRTMQQRPLSLYCLTTSSSIGIRSTTLGNTKLSLLCVAKRCSKSGTNVKG